MNPFEQNALPVSAAFKDWASIYPKPYNKCTVDPYTRVRIILMNGAEFEANWFSHQFARHCPNNDVRRELALVRRVEQQQQKVIAMLKPIDESILETTIGYEQVAVDLTAILAKRMEDCDAKRALDFALLEDFDHLYRYANLLEMDAGIHAENIVGRYTEIMPGRPTISEHRYPCDNVRRFIDFQTASMETKLAVNIITAAEQQTMNYYMNAGQFYCNDIGRKLYQEIALIEEQHVTHYESLIDPTLSWFESLLMHEYTECYLYYSCFLDETDPYVKAIWEQHYYQEVSHLHKAAWLLQKYEGKCWKEVIPCGTFPAPLRFGPNIEYVRDILKREGSLTNLLEDYVPVCDMPKNAMFFRFQNVVNRNVNQTPSHMVINRSISQGNKDYRFEVAPNPQPCLRSRTCDNTTLGRVCDCCSAGTPCPQTQE